MTDFQQLGTAAAGEALLDRNDLPSGAQAWGRVGRSVARIPVQLAESFSQALQDLRVKATSAPTPALALAVAATLAIVLGALLLRHLVHTRLVAGQPDSTLATPAAAVRDSILSLVPAAVWWGTAYILDLERRTILLVGGVLAIWPVVSFVLLLARRRNPMPKATVYEFQEAAVIIRLQYYARLRGAVGGLDIRSEILTRVRDAFAEAGFAIPTPSGEVTLPHAELHPALEAPT